MAAARSRPLAGHPSVTAKTSPTMSFSSAVVLKTSTATVNQAGIAASARRTASERQTIAGEGPLLAASSMVGTAGRAGPVRLQRSRQLVELGAQRCHLRLDVGKASVVAPIANQHGVRSLHQLVG